MSETSDHEAFSSGGSFWHATEHSGMDMVDDTLGISHAPSVDKDDAEAVSPFPTTVSDLAFSSFTSSGPSIYQSLRQLRRSTLSIPNRLRSVLADSAFVVATANQFALPLIANERCGSWYIPPELKTGSAYFKSTDGHYGQWAFSLRRLNLGVLETLGAAGGAVVVDSTRRGKRMPDALRRTVPIWVNVWNEVLFGSHARGHDIGLERPAAESHIQTERGSHLRPRLCFQRAPGMEDGEVSQIETRIQGWVQAVQELGLDLEDIRNKTKKPIRCVWVVNGEGVVGGQEAALDHLAEHSKDPSGFHMLVLCSASKRVAGAEMSEDGYIQGAGDDSEGWSLGLSSALFWAHRDELMETPEDNLPTLINRLVGEQRTGKKGDDHGPIQVHPMGNVFTSVQDGQETAAGEYALVVRCNSTASTASPTEILDLGCRPGKLGSKDLRNALNIVKPACKAVLTKNKQNKILVSCETGKDLSVGVIIALSCLWYDDQGHLQLDRDLAIDKQLVKKRLAWITTVKPDANPSRATLQAVNSFLMERPT